MKSAATLFTTVALAMLVWVFFYELDMPLHAPDTAVVTGICLAVVLLGKATFTRLRRRRATAEAAKSCPAPEQSS